MAEPITLQCCGDETVTVDGWESVAEASKGITYKNYCSSVQPGQTIALYDRNAPTEAWRCVFAVRGSGDDVYIFDDKGAKIDEPDAGVPKGVTPLQGEEGTFLDDWANDYYKVVHQPEPDPSHDDTEPEEEPINENPYVHDPRCVKGARLAISFEGEWEGCTVDEVIAEPLALLLAFDDGDLKARTSTEIAEDSRQNCIKYLSAEAGGLVQNVEGVPAAVRAARHRDGRSAAARPVGVLVGNTDYCLAGDPIIQSFFVDSDAFSSQNKSCNTRGSSVSAQDRLGFHTFRRGDVVTYVYVSDGEECKAHVFGVTWPEADAGRKYLVLQEASSGTFFAGSYTDWRRMHKSQDADPDDNDTALTQSREDCDKMLADWETSDKLAHLDSAKKVANATRSLPPHLKSQRSQAQRAAKEHDEEEKKRARREEVLARGKRTGKGKGKGKGGGAKGRGGRAGGKDGKAEDQVVLNDDDDDDERPLSDRRRPPANAAALVAAAKATATRKHAAEMRALQQQLAAAKALQAQPQVPVQQVLQQVLSQAPAASPVLTSPPEPPPLLAHSTLPAGWRSATDAAGRRYYYNKSLNTSTYDMPEADSPPLPPPSAPSVHASHSQHASQGSASCNTGASSSFESFEAEQRRRRITYIKGYLTLCENKLEKAELQGELAVLQREEHVYKQSQDPLAARLF